MKAVSRIPATKTEAGPEFYVPGGALNPDAPSYIPRAADEELPQALLAGEYCYVLTPRQMGKSSLMYRTADALSREGIRSVTIDLTGIGTGVTEDQWYLGHLLRIKKDLKLAIDYLAWWRANGHLGAVQRFGLFLTDVALREIAEPIAIFIDEIDTTLNLAYSDDYFAAIRSLHIQRANDPELRRLRFVLLGVASPSDLIKDAARTPFNIGRRIALGDFNLDEMAPLGAGLAPDSAMAGELLNAIVRWTGGHPFLTQTACRRVAEWVRSPKFRPSEVPAIVDGLVKELFISESGRNKDPNLQFVRDRILEHERAVPLLSLYRQIRRGETILDDELDPLRAALKLSGLIVTADGGLLKVRNRIYSSVFDDFWVNVALKRASFDEGRSLLGPPIETTPPDTAPPRVRKPATVPADVFLNIPFDKHFQDLYLAYIAGLTSLGFHPRATIEIPSGERRLDRILSLIQACPYSVHDLSRVGADAPRFNMPLELGMAVAWQRLNPDRSRWFVFEAKQHGVEKSVSDLGGTDVFVHGDRPIGLFSGLTNAFIRQGNRASVEQMYTVFLGLKEALPALMRKAATESPFESRVFDNLRVLARQLSDRLVGIASSGDSSLQILRAGSFVKQGRKPQKGKKLPGRQAIRTKQGLPSPKNGRAGTGPSRPGLTGVQRSRASRKDLG